MPYSNINTECLLKNKPSGDVDQGEQLPALLAEEQKPAQASPRRSFEEMARFWRTTAVPTPAVFLFIAFAFSGPESLRPFSTVIEGKVTGYQVPTASRTNHTIPIPTKLPPLYTPNPDLHASCELCCLQQGFMHKLAHVPAAPEIFDSSGCWE